MKNFIVLLSGLLCSLMLFSCNSDENPTVADVKSKKEFEVVVKHISYNEIENLAEGDTLFFDATIKSILKEGESELRASQTEEVKGYITMQKVKTRFKDSGEKLLPSYLTGPEWHIWERYAISVERIIIPGLYGISHSPTGGPKTGWTAATSNNQTRYQDAEYINNGYKIKFTTWVYKHDSTLSSQSYPGLGYFPMHPSEIRLYYTVWM